MLVRERHARDEAERANRLKDHFIATLSHELRTPLNVMLGWTRILETATEGELNARAAALVARNGRVLARLVEDLLDISRASVGQFDLIRTAVHLDAVVKASIDAMVPAAAAKGIDLRSELDAGVEPISADSERIQQVVSNLLSNAVKFTPTGGWVDVRTACRDTTITVTIADSGIGFDSSFHKELFEPFRQADPSSSREHGGLGLGLSIARHLAELHDGSITGSSPGPGRGATFVLTLPRKAVPVTPGPVSLTTTQIG
jgi:signal transduction histidine kinase